MVTVIQSITRTHYFICHFQRSITTCVKNNCAPQIMLNTASELKNTVNFAVDFSKTDYSNFLVTFFFYVKVLIFIA